MQTREYILPLLRQALDTIGAPAGSRIVLDLPREGSRGDLSTGIAFALAGPMRRPPAELAAEIVAALEADERWVERTEVAGGGFINITFTPAFHAIHLERALALQERYGRSDTGAGTSVAVAYLASPPAGPDDGSIHRGAVVANALAHLLEWTGHAVTLHGAPGDTSLERLGVRFAAAPLPADPARLVLVRRDARAPRPELADMAITEIMHGGLRLPAASRGSEPPGPATLDALIEGIGPVSVGIFMLLGDARADLHADRDIDRSRSITNPLHRIPYARFALAALGRAATAQAPPAPDASLADLASPADRELSRKLLLLPHMIERAALELNPSLLLDYLNDAALTAWRFSDAHRLVIPAGEQRDARLRLLDLAGTVLANGLAALGLPAS